jgi:hypothetical protein
LFRERFSRRINPTYADAAAAVAGLQEDDDALDDFYEYGRLEELRQHPRIPLSQRPGTPPPSVLYKIKTLIKQDQHKAGETSSV